MKSEVAQVVVIFVSLVLVHAVPKWSIRTFDGYLIEGVLFEHIFTMKDYCYQFLSVFGRRHVWLLCKARGIGFFLDNGLISRILLEQEVHYLLEGVNVSRITTSLAAIFCVCAFSTDTCVEHSQNSLVFGEMKQLHGRAFD